MKNILAFDCSSAFLSVALNAAGTIYATHEYADKQHNIKLIPTIRSLCEQANIQYNALDVIMVGRGPGSFVGVRLAIGAAQGFGFGLGVPLIAISSMQLIAQSWAHDHERVMVKLDAKMGDCYVGKYHRVQQVMVSEQEWAEPNDADSVTADYYMVAADAAIPDASQAFALYDWACDSGLLSTPNQIQPVYLQGDQHWRKL